MVALICKNQALRTPCHMVNTGIFQVLPYSNLFIQYEEFL